MSAPSGPIWMVPRRTDPDFVGRSDELAAPALVLAASGRGADAAGQRPRPGRRRQDAAGRRVRPPPRRRLRRRPLARRRESDGTRLGLRRPRPRDAACPRPPSPTRMPGPPPSSAGWGPTRAGCWSSTTQSVARTSSPTSRCRLSGHVLITSRNPDWRPLAKGIKIRPLPRVDSIAICGAAWNRATRPRPTGSPRRWATCRWPCAGRRVRPRDRHHLHRLPATVPDPPGRVSRRPEGGARLRPDGRRDPGAGAGPAPWRSGGRQPGGAAAGPLRLPRPRPNPARSARRRIPRRRDARRGDPDAPELLAGRGRRRHRHRQRPSPRAAGRSRSDGPRGAGRIHQVRRSENGREISDGSR